jgi:cobalt/nickel transport system permease protein
MFLSKTLKKIPRWMLIYYILILSWAATTAMHIPDGYLSPVTCALMAVMALPFWIRGVQTLREKMNARNISLVALFAAFSFVVMMFNVPLPGGTTGHAVGGALAAIILGPEIATIAISVALVIQAFFFGDGGILALGANCFNMAVVLPYVSYAVYQAIARNMPLDSKRRVVGAALGGWAGLTVASFFAAVEFGVQPLLWHMPDGTPLYAPYPLSVSIPVMVIPHALVAAVVEGGVTALVIAYLMRANRPALEMVNKTQVTAETGSFARWRAAWIGLAGLVVFTPLGLLAPGTAWGEWSAQKLAGLGLASIPKGLAQLSGLWVAPMPGYHLPSLGNARSAYLLSAVVGMLLTVGLAWLFSVLATRGKKPASETLDRP